MKKDKKKEFDNMLIKQNEVFDDILKVMSGQIFTDIKKKGKNEKSK